MGVVAYDPLPGYSRWLAEADRTYWLGVLRRAAEAHLLTLPPCEGGCGGCEFCSLDEALAYTSGKGVDRG